MNWTSEWLSGDSHSAWFNFKVRQGLNHDDSLLVVYYRGGEQSQYTLNLLTIGDFGQNPI